MAYTLHPHDQTSIRYLFLAFLQDLLFAKKIDRNEKKEFNFILVWEFQSREFYIQDGTKKVNPENCMDLKCSTPVETLTPKSESDVLTCKSGVSLPFNYTSLLSHSSSFIRKILL